MSATDRMRFGIEEAIWLTTSFSALHRCAFDSSLFAQRYPPPLDFVAFSRAIQELGLELQHSTRSLGGVLAWQLPVALLLEHEPSTDAPPSGASDILPTASSPAQRHSDYGLLSEYLEAGFATGQLANTYNIRASTRRNWKGNGQC